MSRLVVAHKTKVRKWAVEDLNVAFPLERMKELEAEGAFKRLAHTAVSMVGSIQRYTELVEQTVPAIKQIYDSQGVDLVFLFPFCPACHRATTVIAQGARGARPSHAEHERAARSRRRSEASANVFSGFSARLPGGKTA